MAYVAYFSGKAVGHFRSDSTSGITMELLPFALLPFLLAQILACRAS